MTTRHLIAAILALVIGIAIYGAYQYPKFIQVGSPAGTNFSSQKIASQAVVVSTSTVFSQLNSDVFDRTISDAFVTWGGGAATSTYYGIKCATSSIATGILSSDGTANTNWVLNTGVSTSTTFNITGSGYGTTTAPGITYLATSSPGLTGIASTSIATVSPNGINTFVRAWKANSYLVCQSVALNAANANNLLDAATTGATSFRYFGQ